jgi:hypothetical protein
LTFFNFNARSPREPQGPPLASYPPSVRRVFFWYDSLTDWQRIQYAGITILFLLACGGYMLGLGSAVVLARVDSDQAALAADAPPTDEPTQEPTATALPVVPTAIPSDTPVPSPTRPPTPVPTSTPFSAPVIAEPPAAPREVPAAPAAPAVIAPRFTATSARPRILETAPAVVPTEGVRVIRTAPPATSAATPVREPIREATSAPTTRAQSVATVAPTTVVTQAIVPTALLKPSGATTAPTRPAAGVTPAAQATPLLQPAQSQQTPVKTPATR